MRRVGGERGTRGASSASSGSGARDASGGSGAARERAPRGEAEGERVGARGAPPNNKAPHDRPAGRHRFPAGSTGSTPADLAPTVRQATLADLDTVVHLRLALLHEHHAHPIYGRLRPDAPERARELFASQLRSPDEAIFLAHVGARSVGILRVAETIASPLFIPSRYGYVSSVYVLPELRRRGVLRALLRRAERWCAARGLGELRLHNVSEGSAAAPAWEALGFTVIEQLRMKRL